MSDPGDGSDQDEGESDPVEWLDGIEWSEEPPENGGEQSAGVPDDRIESSEEPPEDGSERSADFPDEGSDRSGGAPDDGIERSERSHDDGTERPAESVDDGIDAVGENDAGTRGDAEADADPELGGDTAAVGDVATEPTADAEGEVDPTPDAEGDPTVAGAGSGVDPEAATTDRIRAALTAVRREVRKAALVHAAVEGALVAVVANLLLSLATPAALSGSVALPGVVPAALRGLPVVGPVAPRTIGVASLAAVGVGGFGTVGAYFSRLRRPLIEQFEAANPPVREALRTARDAVEGGSDTAMARRLYADVIATLRETSTLELVDARRLTVTVVLVAVLAVASVQVAVINPDLAGVLPGGSDPGATIEGPDDDEELQDGEEILGDAEDVEAGEDVENITVPGTGEGEGGGSAAPGGGTGGSGGSGEFDSQQAGFAGDERLEDAELVREYNLRIREFDDGSDTDDDTA